MKNSLIKFFFKTKVKFQVFGGFLAAMIMPIIGIFIAWGLGTSFFIPTGWLPNKDLSGFVGVGIIYLIPILIGFLGGKKIYGTRGAVIGALVTASVIAAGQSNIYKSIIYNIDIKNTMELEKQGGSIMILGAMIFVPLAALTLKHTEKYWIKSIKPGFEMLINNFYLGILGFILVCISFYSSTYSLSYLTKGLGILVKSMEKYKLYPILSFIIEPAKVLFLNNAINHGVFTPIGTEIAKETGKSILFLLESNPGPGFGILIAYILFSKDKTSKAQAGSSGIIHLFGGIHEVYFPFILAKPMLIFAAIGGGVVGNSIFQLFDVGAVAPVSPGSIIAQFLQVEKTGLSVSGLVIGIVSSATASLFISFLIFKFQIFKKFIYKLLKKEYHEKEIDIKQAINKTTQMKNESKNILNSTKKIDYSQIYFVCDAGMGSSAMANGILRKLLKENNLNEIEVKHKSITDMNGNEKVVVINETLYQRALEKNKNAKYFILKNFLAKEEYQKIIEQIKNESN
ncbi:PTS mannitol transporter subunit IICB [Mycoplasmopsis cricetuli]|uniref:PTS mannitol transporter subunit IICB n=1 Tax=Mycoplasmopsis cricetuli TaxID=171283 RepID=UPI00046FC1BE|nr:PTS mannitol transporter subunit IICB [Mycoplasmopsis cricetuli]